MLNYQDFGSGIRSAIDRLFRQFDAENMGEIINDITRIATAFKYSVKNNICEQYAQRVIELVTILQLCLIIEVLIGNYVCHCCFLLQTLVVIFQILINCSCVF